MLLRVVKIYLVLSTIVIFSLAGFAAYTGLKLNPQSVYCNYAVDESEANYVAQGVPCRVRFGALLQVFGLTTLAIAATAQLPAYVYFLVRYIRRARSKPKP
jgi:hypothetical protein